MIPSQDNITAYAGGGIGSATAITVTPMQLGMARVATVASPGDSVIMGASFAGSVVRLLNNGPNIIQVFATGSDTIDGIAGSVGISQNPGTYGSIAEYMCLTSGQWISAAYYIAAPGATGDLLLEGSAGYIKLEGDTSGKIIL